MRVQSVRFHSARDSLLFFSPRNGKRELAVCVLLKFIDPREVVAAAVVVVVVVVVV